MLLLTVTLSAVAAERQLAGIKLGMRPQEVTGLLGQPTATIIAQPPLNSGDNTPSPLSITPPGMGPGQPTRPTSVRANSLILIYERQEYELSADQTISFDGKISGSQVPPWIYTVRVARLALDQQEMIYRINDTYSLGITVTGEDREARVSDIIACSVLPLTYWPADPKREFNLKDAFYKDIFKYKYGNKHELPAGTSKKVTIGSKLDDVLRKQKWPDYFIPFSSTPAATMTLDPRYTQPVYAAPGPAPTDGGNTTFSLGSSTLNINFANNCILLYPDDGLALTLINDIVIRVQIGKELTRPSMEDFVPSNGAGALRPPARSGQ